MKETLPDDESVEFGLRVDGWRRGVLEVLLFEFTSLGVLVTEDEVNLYKLGKTPLFNTQKKTLPSIPGKSSQDRT